MLKCYQCVYKGDIPGDVHFACRYQWSQEGAPPRPKFKGSPRQAQWFLFPWNFDPIWAADCEAFQEKDKGRPGANSYGSEPDV